MPTYFIFDGYQSKLLNVKVSSRRSDKRWMKDRDRYRVILKTSKALGLTIPQSILARAKA